MPKVIFFSQPFKRLLFVSEVMSNCGRLLGAIRLIYKLHQKEIRMNRITWTVQEDISLMENIRRAAMGYASSSRSQRDFKYLECRIPPSMNQNELPRGKFDVGNGLTVTVLVEHMSDGQISIGPPQT